MQELEVGWRLALATVIGFLGSAFGTVGGVGGGGIFVPMLTLIVGFDTKSAAALSKCNSLSCSSSSSFFLLVYMLCVVIRFVVVVDLLCRYDNGGVSIFGLV